MILPRPLDPVEYVPEGSPPEILNIWSGGAILVLVRHGNSQHCLPAKKDCQGEVTVPILPGESGDKDRFCEGCGEKV